MDLVWQVQARENSQHEAGGWAEDLTPMTVFYLLGDGETVFSETVTLGKVTTFQWRTTHPRRFKQHKWT